KQVFFVAASEFLGVFWRRHVKTSPNRGIFFSVGEVLGPFWRSFRPILEKLCLKTAIPQAESIKFEGKRRFIEKSTVRKTFFAEKPVFNKSGLWSVINRKTNNKLFIAIYLR
ncbi:MAG: hypothetical protein MJ153_07250, partial [Clostridia bacterium]|nr:hypothetical protein [Clostridia bacterium]